MAGHGTGSVSGIVAFHFVGNTLRDGRPVPPDGEWLVHDGPVTLCESGLHASRRPWHALQYAPGAVLCLVEVADIVAEGYDKLVARRRRIVRRVDLTADLRAFARACARDVLHLWDAPDVVRRYLETGDESIREAASAAASAAARADLAEDAASAAASAAAWAAVSADPAWAAATTVAARAAASSAASSAASAAASARAAVRAAQGERFDAICRARLGVEETA